MSPEFGSQNPVKVIDRIAKQVESGKIKPAKLISDAAFVWERAGEGERGLVRPFLQEAVRRAPEGTMQVAFIDQLTELYRKDQTNHKLGDTIRSYIEMGKDLGIATKPEGQAFLQAVEKEYGLVPTTDNAPVITQITTPIKPTPGSVSKEKMSIVVTPELDKAVNHLAKALLKGKAADIDSLIHKIATNKDFTGYNPWDIAELVTNRVVSAGRKSLRGRLSSLFRRPAAEGNLHETPATRLPDTHETAEAERLTTLPPETMQIVRDLAQAWVIVSGEQAKARRAEVRDLIDILVATEIIRGENETARESIEKAIRREFNQALGEEMVKEVNIIVERAEKGEFTDQRLAEIAEAVTALGESMGKSSQTGETTTQDPATAIRKLAETLDSLRTTLKQVPAAVEEAEQVQQALRTETARLDAELAGLRGGEPSGTLQLEKPEIPVYDKPWQEVFGGATLQAWKGFSGTTYRPTENPDVVVKVFDNHSEDQPRELGILEKLQGLPHIVKLLGHGGPSYWAPKERYLVKEYIEGENLLWAAFETTFPTQPGEKDPFPESSTKMAAWLVSSLEAVGEIHDRGILISDFKFADFPWDKRRGITIAIDFANAFEIGGPLDKLTISEQGDIDDFLKIFLSRTPIGKNMDMYVEEDGAKWQTPIGLPKQYGYNEQTLQIFKEKAQQTGATPAFLKVIDLIQDTVRSYPDHKDHSAQELANALKDYFKEVGIDISPIDSQVDSRDNFVTNLMELNSMHAGTTKAEVAGRAFEEFVSSSENYFPRSSQGYPVEPWPEKLDSTDKDILYAVYFQKPADSWGVSIDDLIQLTGKSKSQIEESIEKLKLANHNGIKNGWFYIEHSVLEEDTIHGVWDVGKDRRGLLRFLKPDEAIREEAIKAYCAGYTPAERYILEIKKFRQQNAGSV